MSDEELALVNEVLSRNLGLFYPDYKRSILASRLAPRLDALHLSTFYDYYLALEVQPDAELDWLSRHLTNNETYFFRESYQFEAFFRSLAQGRRPAEKECPVRVLSAGCSSGEEPYSLQLYQRFRAGAGSLRERLEIDAVDIDGDRIEQARRGVYSAYSLRTLDDEDRRRWFRRSPSSNGSPAAVDRFELRSAYRGSVDFHRVNLLEPAGWSPAEPYSAIFCRNVMIYFSAEAVRRLLEQLAAWLAPDGLLFLGHAETLYGHRAPFVSERLDGCIAYRKIHP